MPNNTEVCRVESVQTTDAGVFLDVQHLSRPSVDYRNIPIQKNFSGIIAVPSVGQKVVVSKDSTGYEYVEGVITGPKDSPPELSEQEFALQFDPTTKITAKKDGSGGYNLSIEASGNVQVKAGGDILVGENGEPVARQNHTHDYVGGGDNSSTKTSDTPNESGTDTKIQ